MSMPEISDDDDSFEDLQRLMEEQEKKSQLEVVEISDDSNQTLLYDQDCLTSDEELPNVALTNLTKERDKVIKNLFTKVQPSTSIENSNVNKAGVVRMIGGVPVSFPVQPYGAQMALMAKVIESISKKVNCLLESPTGSGKTLALLCAALAWQKHERNRIADIQSKQFVEQHPELKDVKGVETISNPPSTFNPEFSFIKAAFGDRSIYDEPTPSESISSFSYTNRMEPSHFGGSSPPDDGLVAIHKHKKQRIGDPPEVCSPPEFSTPKKEYPPPQAHTPEKISVPTIYYGARTHKQIQQVVKEFSKTAYCGDAKMTILSSREYSCIRPFDRSLYASKNDMCRECTKKVKTKVTEPGEPGSTNCKFYENRKDLNWKSLPPAFDLEDLESAGRELNACPFFAARLMVPGAQIVFCPYNYLIDPSIRNSLQIVLRDEIVILDEAHNIEDICRESATFLFSRDHIMAALKEMEYLSSLTYANQNISSEMATITKALNNWNYWFGNQLPFVADKPVNNNEAIHCLHVGHFANTLNDHHIGLKDYPDFQRSVEMFCMKLRDDPQHMYGITQSTGTLLESLSTVLGYIFRNNCQDMDDFKPVLIRTVNFTEENAPDANGWRRTDYNKKVSKESLSLRIMCLNPGVVFSALSPARCVLLASGTLTPLVSLHSELGSHFPLAVSPNHVVPKDRVWIGTLSSCPDGSQLECKAQSTGRVGTQDALGAAVLWVSQVTPNGVLCFLPSYQLMNNLKQRWRETGLWRKLQGVKNIFMESRNVKDHNDVMEVVNELTGHLVWQQPPPMDICNTDGITDALPISKIDYHRRRAVPPDPEFYKSVSSRRGALLFAVYRGKVSEGMDFKDEQARAVITIGIPYPNTFDMSVKEKMSYNDRHVTDKRLLRSGEWLRVQAYRALNQAIGRCVRHRRDWGAVLLIDARFTQPENTLYLSKWVREYMGDNHHTFESLTNSLNGLESFMQSMTLRDKEDVDI